VQALRELFALEPQAGEDHPAASVTELGSRRRRSG